MKGGDKTVVVDLNHPLAEDARLEIKVLGTSRPKGEQGHRIHDPRAQGRNKPTTVVR